MNETGAAGNIGAPLAGAGPAVNHSIETKGVLGAAAVLFESVFLRACETGAGKSKRVAIPAVGGLDAEVVVEMATGKNLEGGAV